MTTLEVKDTCLELAIPTSRAAVGKSIACRDDSPLSMTRPEQEQMT